MMSAIPRPQANPRKTTSVRQLGSVNVDALLVAVKSIPESVWDAENADKPNKFEALDKMCIRDSGKATAGNQVG